MLWFTSSLKRNPKTAIVLALLVLSHWFLDLFVHIPDLPIFPGASIKVGFGLWNSFAATLILEGLIFVVGVFFTTNQQKQKIKQALIL
ncbi:MAG: hypothetical protein MZV64_57445 [Ignavibacteriales bacterium]|nr:hypothetical protein [Ignavibacteriales bacterium]